MAAKKLYKVMNVGAQEVEGITTVQGQTARYRLSALTLELVSAEEHQSTIKLCFHGDEIEKARAHYKEGAVVALDPLLPAASADEVSKSVFAPKGK